MPAKTITELSAAGTLDGTELMEVAQLSTTVTITATTISAQASDNSYNDSGSGFVAAGFAVGDRVYVEGFTGNVANNILTGVITALTTAKMTIGGTDGDVIVDDAAGESVTITKWTSKRVQSQDVGDLGGGGSGGPASSSTQSGTTYTAVLGDANTYIRFTNGSAVTFTIPPNASVAFPVDTVIALEQAGAGTVTIAPGSGVTLNSRGAALDTAGQYAVAQLKKVATDTWTVLGDLA